MRFVYAFRGIALFFKTQRNSWIHLFAAITAIAMGFLFSITQLQWLFIVCAIGLVFTAEALNTAIEFLADFVSPEWNDKIGHVKDVAAGAVLFAAFTALAIGLIIFVPYLLACFS